MRKEDVIPWVVIAIFVLAVGFASWRGGYCLLHMFDPVAEAPVICIAR